MLLLLLACAEPGGTEDSKPIVATDDDGDGWTAAEGDCDDTDPSIHPGAIEVCDGVDEDCDTVVDEDAVDADTLHPDTDGDGYGSDDTTTLCPGAPGYVADGGDCADADPAIHPGVVEVCDGVDQDCDTLVDEDASDATLVYTDADGDGYGDPATATYTCSPAGDQVLNDGDCDDTEPLAWTGAEDTCADGVDNDCDGLAPDGCMLTGHFLAEDGVWHTYGNQVAQEYGSSIAVVGDWTGDGLPEVMVGAPEMTYGDMKPGAVLVVEAGDWTGEAPADAAIAIAYGPDSYAAIGQAMDTLGDLDGDGLDEVAVGAPGALYEGTGGQPGIVYVYEGLADGAPIEIARLIGEELLTETGWSLAAAGDVTGDGVPDLLVGHYNLGGEARTYTGGAQVVSGARIAEGGDVLLADDGGATLAGGELAMAGMAVAAGDDVDGDGVDDVIVGSRGLSDSAAWLVTEWPSADGTLLDAAATRVLTENTTEFEGIAVALPGDMDGDGYGELAVGAIWDGVDQQGGVYLIAGSRAGDVTLGEAWALLQGEGSEAHAGISLDGLDDVDGDGKEDLLVGSRGYNDQDGAAYAVVAPPTGTSSLADVALAWYGTTHDGLGQYVRAAGDVDGDGVTDVFLGQPYEYETHTAGDVWLWTLGAR